MCLAIPGKVKKVMGSFALFDYEGKEYQCDISFASDVKVGSWVLMHDGRALSKVSAREAKENLELIKDFESKNY